MNYQFSFRKFIFKKTSSKNAHKKAQRQLKTHLFTFTIMNEALAKLQSFQQIISHSINEHENDFFLFFILLLNVRDDISGVI